jgi:hypothetical protein
MRHVPLRRRFHARVELERIARTVLERSLRANQRAPLRGVGLGQQTGHRYGRKRGIAVVRVPIGVRELDRLVDLVDVFGGIDAGRLEIDALQNIQRL